MNLRSTNQTLRPDLPLEFQLMSRYISISYFGTLTPYPPNTITTTTTPVAPYLLMESVSCGHDGLVGGRRVTEHVTVLFIVRLRRRWRPRRRLTTPSR